MTFLMAGGGTGGHVIPAIAVAEELRSRGHTPFFVGTTEGLESSLVPGAGFVLETILIGRFQRVGRGQQLRTLTQLPASVMAVRRFIAKYTPRAIFSMGGYVAAPSILAASWMRLPVIGMEPNAHPGLVTRRLSRLLSRALVSFEQARRYLHCPVEVTGLPVRREFFAVETRPPATPFTVLVTGGSQGSKRINEALRDAWPILAQAGWPLRFIHQAGRATFADFALAFDAAAVPGEIVQFIDDMPAAFRRADLVVCRAGAGAVSELAAAGKPSILIPFPFAADDHQTHNARAMEATGAAQHLAEASLSGASLARALLDFVAHPDRLLSMSACARAMAKPAAAQRAADLLEEVAQ